jgi:hypothetical protein
MKKRSMRRKNVNNSRIASLLSLAALGLLLAVPTQAQNDATQKMDQYLNRLRPQKPTSDAPPSVNQLQSASARQSRITADTAAGCSYSFTSGSGATYMDYCVTVNGTLANFESPAGIEMLYQNGAGEGYGVCEVQTGGSYWDYNYGNSGNWNAPVTVTESATEVKIERSPADGSFLLTQTISKVSGTSPAARIVMSLKNTSGGVKTFYLMRYANFVPDQAASTGNYYESYDGSTDSAWGYIPNFPTYSSTSGEYGLMLNNIAEPAPPSTVIVYYGYDYSSFFGPDPCQPLEYDTEGNKPTVGTVVNGLGSGTVLYELELNNNQAATVNLRYFGF